MTNNDNDFPLTLQKKGKEVKIYRTCDKARKEEYFTVTFYVGNNRRRVNRRSLDDARKVAMEKLEEMVRGKVPVSLDHRDWELLKEVKRVAKDRPPWRLLEDVRAASMILKGAASMAEAAEFWVARHHHKADGEVSKIYEEYIRQLEQKSSERNTRDARNRVGKFEAAFGGHLLSDVTPDAILAFLQSMSVESRTKNNYRAQIVTFFRWARKRGYLEEGRETAPEKVDPWKIIEKEVTIFTVEQTRALFRNIRKDVEAYTAIGAFAGLRPSETQRLTWGAINFESKHIHVTAEIARKVNRARYVPIADNLIEWLTPHRKGDEEKVGFYKAAEILSADAIKRGVVQEWPADVLRHSFCSYRLAETNEIGRVAEEAGNSAAIIRRHYRRPVQSNAASHYFNIRPGNLES